LKFPKDEKKAALLGKGERVRTKDHFCVFLRIILVL